MSLWSRFQRRLGDLAGELVLDDYRDQLNQAEGLVRAGNVTAAIDVLEALLAVKPDHGQALILLGEARLTVREPDRARDAFERALAQRSDDPAGLIGLGHALVMMGRYSDAIAPLQRAITEAGGDRGLLAESYRGLGVAWRRSGHLDKAIRELRKAVAEDGDDLEARASLGEALVSEGGAIDEAVRHLERAANVDAPPALALYGLARVALLEDAPTIASERLERARAIADLDATQLGTHRRQEIIIAQGDAALARSDAMAAHGYYLEALALEPRRAELHAKIASAHRAIGNLDAALTSFDRAIALAEASRIDLAVLRAAIDTAIDANDRTRSLQWSADLLARVADDPRAIVARGVALLDDQPVAARAMLELAAARDDVDAHLALATLALTGDPQRAAQSALAALRIAPRHSRARSLLSAARGREFAPPNGEIGELAGQLERLVGSRRELGHFVGEVSRAAAGLDQPLLVTVMGEFSSGKSSFVNAFIGADVAPTGITPTTATINVVRYGRERGGRIFGRDGSLRELAWDRLMTTLRELTPEAARDIDRVEILVPLPQLEKINIVDTPGLNSIQPEHEATARGFIARADAVVWLFTAAQGGKASEQRALRAIHDEGKRVLGVLNKADQLTGDETRELTAFISGELGQLVEAIVPCSARAMLAWKQRGDQVGDDGNWRAIADALETRFFQQARQLKRDACARTLRGVIAAARTVIEDQRSGLLSAAVTAAHDHDDLRKGLRDLVDDLVRDERTALSEHCGQLYRRAAREVLDLVRPRRLPFSSHTATTADRDYLIALLVAGFESGIEAGRQRVAERLRSKARALETSARGLALALGSDVGGDLARTAEGRINLVLSRVFDRTLAFVRGYLEGGSIEAFFRTEVPKLDLAEDAVYRALFARSPDLDRQLDEPLARAASEALEGLAGRLDHWAAIADLYAFDLEVGIARSLEAIAACV